MAKLNESKIVEAMRLAYLRRLHEVIGETDVKDKRGNVVISPGLKVRHKKSQFEYTVSSVKEDPKSGDVVITLKSPEMPRFTPSGGQEFVGEETPLLTGAAPTSGHDEELAAMAQPDAVEGEETVFMVDEKEFKKDYEVK
jgi:hypothetical protein